MARRKQRGPEKFEKWTLEEVTICDLPAQEGAAITIAKAMGADDDEDEEDEEERAERKGEYGAADVRKSIKLTTVTDGHQHMLEADPYQTEGGHTSYESAAGEDMGGHSHAWVRNADGSCTIAMNEGHTHDLMPDRELTVVMSPEVGKRMFDPEERERLVDAGHAMPDGSFAVVTKADLQSAVDRFGLASDPTAVAKHIKSRAAALGAEEVLPNEGALAVSKSRAEGAHTQDPHLKEGRMPNPKDAGAKPSEADKRIADLEKRLEAATAMASLTDVEKAHYGSLDEAGQVTFLAAEPADRAKDVAKAASSDPVVYTAADGTEFRKSDDSRLVKLAKSADEEREIAKRERVARETMEFEKTADADLSNLPGEKATKVALLRAVSKISDEETREEVRKTLRAQNAEMAAAFNKRGSKKGGTDDKAGEAEEELDKRAKKLAEEKSIPFAKAYEAVLETPEGAKLYNQSEAERASRV